ncbi:MAG: MFS transporter, partial [Sulfobacillus thermotolerans]|nr:MFS transporter [Sulfobacillus thermotolerans]
MGLAVRVLPSLPATTKAPRLDTWGLILLSPALAGLFYGVSMIGSRTAYPILQIIIPVIVGILCLILYIVHALTTPRSPLIDIRLLHIRSFSAAILIQLMFGFSLFGSLLVLPLFYQDVRHQTALMAGILLAPQGIGALAARWVVGHNIEEFGIRNWSVIGVVAVALGTLPFSLVGGHAPEWLLATSLIIRGAGLSTVVIAVSVGVYRDVPAHAVASASSMSEIIQQLGGAVGSEVLALILAESLHHISPFQAVRAYEHTLWWSIVFLSAILIPSLWLPRQSPRVSD